MTGFCRVVSVVPLLAALAFPGSLAAQDKVQVEVKAEEKAVLLLDGSGSMWGQMDGVAKIDMARDAVRDLLKSWDKEVKLGVTAYGHRAESDCSDIEAMVPVGALDSDKVAGALDKIQPKGKTPIAASVRKAAESLNYKEEKATIILVSDGMENCNADPCAVAKELEATGKDLTVHVVGLDVNDREMANVQCIAENTGGRVFRTNTVSEFYDAMDEMPEAVAGEAPPAKASDGEPAEEAAKGSQ